MNPSPTSNFRSPAALACFFLTAVLGFSADLWTKHIAFEKLAVYNADGELVSNKVYDFIPGWLHFTVTVNHGAVFGLGEGKRILFIAVSVAAIVFLSYLFATSGRQRLYQFILGMLLAGVLGNMYDRIQFGYVRDMIHGLPQWPKLFPWIFNVADVLLCTGVGLMIVYSLFQPKPAPDPFGVAQPASDTPAPS